MRQNGQVMSLCTGHQRNPTSDFATAEHVSRPPCYKDGTPEFGSTTPTVTSIFILTLLEPATALPLLAVMLPGMTDMTIAGKQFVCLSAVAVSAGDDRLADLNG